MKAVLDHIGIAVSELDESLAFFRDALGLEVTAVEEVASQRVRAHFVLGSGCFALALGDPAFDHVTAPPWAPRSRVERCRYSPGCDVRIESRVGQLEEIAEILDGQ